ncbi:MAG: hypothetical protein ABDH28_04765 [Brevinematia bacterium]
MRKIVKVIPLVVVTNFILTNVYSVITIDRTYMISPLKTPIGEKEFNFLTFTAATAEFGKYLPEPFTDFNHFWIAKASVFGELFRYKNLFSIVLFSDIELIASSNNIIYFDPRSFYWQEGILFSYKYGTFNFQGSFTHRCKHDIDNADLVTLYDEVRARVIIWDSVWLRFFPDPLEIYNLNNFMVVEAIPFIRNDFYVMSVDETVWYKTYPYTSFKSDSEYKVNKIVDSFSIGMIVDVELFKNFGFYAKGYWWFDLLGDNEIWKWSKIENIVTEHYAEIALYLKDKGGKIFIFLQNNLVRDPAIEPFDQGSLNVFHFGIRAISEMFSL